MARNVRCGLIQARTALGSDAPLTEIKRGMIDRHVELLADAAHQGARAVCLQELFYGPYFCAEQETRWYQLTERVPDGPTSPDVRDRAHAQHGADRPDLRGGTGGRLLQHRGRDRRGRDATSENTERPTSRTASRASGRNSTSGRATSVTRCSTRPSGRVGVYICYDRHFPEGARALGLNGAEIVFNPSATVAGLSEYLWKLEQPAHAVANGYFVGAINRVGIEAPWNIGEFYGTSYFCDPRGQIVAEAPRDQDHVLVADLNLDLIEEVRAVWQFYRDRRPEAYGQLVAP